MKTPMSIPASVDPEDTSCKTDHADEPHGRTYSHDSDRHDMQRMDMEARTEVPQDEEEAEQIQPYTVNLDQTLDSTDVGHEARGTTYTEDDPAFINRDKPSQSS